MANKTLFAPVSRVPVADTINEAGGLAYSMTAKHALAQLACTGCLGSTFYTDASSQLDKVIELANQVEPSFLAKTAIYSRNRGKMKDMPALLMVLLSKVDPKLFQETFDKVIDSGKMVRNFVQIVLSGKCGRKSLGTGPKRAIQRWFANHDGNSIFKQSIGNSPTLGGVIKLAHVKASDPEQDALFKYLLGYEARGNAHLPSLVQRIEAFRKTPDAFEEVPPVSFEWLASLPLTDNHWKEIARHATWLQSVKNINTFSRHRVFKNEEMVELVAKRIADPEQVARTKAFPYQLLVSYLASQDTAPYKISNALQDAMELATANVPAIKGQVYILVDVSGSMHSPITGSRGSATSEVTCLHVAALFAATVLRKNPSAQVIPFTDRVVTGIHLNSRNSVMTNTQMLACLPPGGTNCSAPLRMLNQDRAKGDAVVFISDNESWVDTVGNWRSTQLMEEWRTFNKRNPKSKMVNIDLQPYANTQTKEHKDILQVGGFSNDVFDVVSSFLNGSWGSNHWVSLIENENGVNPR